MKDRTARRNGLVHPHGDVLRFKERGISDETKVGREIHPQANGCWLWKGQGAKYAKTTISDQRYIQVYRYVYETLVGPIPEGEELHHTCETPGCCNPKHLVPLTSKEHKAAHRIRHA